MISEPNAQVDIPLYRDEACDEACDVLLVHDDEHGAHLNRLFGSRLLCQFVTYEKVLAEESALTVQANSVVIFMSETRTNQEVQLVKDVIDRVLGPRPTLECQANKINVREVSNFVMLCCIVPMADIVQDFIDEKAKPAVRRVVLQRVRSDKQLQINADDLDVQFSNDFNPLRVFVHAKHKPPPTVADSTFLTPRDTEEVQPVPYEQARVAEALLRRTKTMFKEDEFNKFNDVQFLICVPDFTTLQAQTACRVRKAGLLDRERCEDEFSKVVMYVPKGPSQVKFDAFKKRAKQEPETLFVIIADVS